MSGISDLRFRTADSGSAILDFGFHIPHSAIRNLQWTGCMRRLSATARSLTLHPVSSLASFAFLREASPFSIFSRQDAKSAKVFKRAGL